MRTYLLVVDMQEGFMSENTAHVPSRIRKLLESHVFDNVVFTRFRNAPASPYRRLLGWQKLSSAHEQAVTSELSDLAEDVIDKDVYTAISPALLERLKAENVSAVFIAGVDTDCCVLTTAVDLFQAGIRPSVLSYYCASNGGGASHTAALTCLGRLIGLHNLIAGEVGAEDIAAILAESSPAKAIPSLEKVTGFVATMDGLTRALHQETLLVAERIITFLDLDFRDSLDASVGVWEQYTLREHVHMVIGQYAHYFARQGIAGLDENEMLLLLGLHDIGKPAAVQAGDKKLQHEYTRRMADSFLEHLGHAEDYPLRRLVRAMSTGDPIGEMLKTGDTESSLATLQTAASAARMSMREYFDFARAFFMVDASSYTSDATMPDGRPGFESLDWLFRFDRENSTMELAAESEAKLAPLQTAVNGP